MEASTNNRKLFRLMVNLDPVKLKIKGQLASALAALIVLDPTSDHRHVVKFLTKGFDEAKARGMVKKQAMRVNPYSFHFHTHLGWLVWAGEDNSCDSLQGVQKVPCLLSDAVTGELYNNGEGGGSSGRSSSGDEEEEGEKIRAYVKVGDQLFLSSRATSSSSSSRRDWWTVHEFRPQSNSILLVARDSSSSNKKKKPCGKVHFYEVHPWVLSGCTIRRSVCLTCFKQFLFSCECGDSHTSHHYHCVFQFPSPDSKAAVAYIESISQGDTDGYSAAFGLMNGDEDGFRSNDDHVYKMQREASVRSWLAQKRNLAQAKAALLTLSPTLSLDRTTWLTVGRILRALSNNSHHSELRDLWAAWSAPRRRRKREQQQQEEEGEECHAVWASLRPPTNCDEPALAKARDYIQQNMSQFTAEHSTASAGANIMVRSIIADANQILRHAILEYWSDSEVLNEKAPKKRVAFGGQAPLRKQITTPAATYSYDAEALRHEVLSGEAGSRSRKPDAGKALTSRSIGQFEELRDVRASIGPGSVISIRDSGESCSGVSAAWFLVLKVDLLFARLRVRPCLAPPLPWLLEEEEEEEGDEAPALWLPVSKMWFALVCSRVESYLGVDRYSIFTAPLPDPSSAISTLEGLSVSAASTQLPPHSTSSSFSSSSSSPLKVLLCGPSSITVGWKFLLADDDAEQYPPSSCSNEMSVHVVSIRLSRPGLIGAWAEVYRGRGGGCSISPLQPASCYHLRLVSSHPAGCCEGHGEDFSTTCYIMAHTT